MGGRVGRVAVAGAVAAFAAGVSSASGAPVLPANQWLGLRAEGPAAVAASCALGGAASADRSVSAWVAVTGSRFLDIIQVGVMATPVRRHFFLAYGNGEPGLASSSYVERDLGPADAMAHAFAVELDGSAWLLSIDGRVVGRVGDGFRTWAIRSVQVATESEGVGDVIGGTPLEPVWCARARARTADGSGSTRLARWRMPAWQLFGYGPSAARAGIRQAEDGFAAWRVGE